MDNWPVNIVGLGLILAGILFAYFLNFVGIIIGQTADAMALSARLLDEGVFVTGFGFPVVPEGTARVRVQMSAALEPEHLDRAIEAFRRVRAA